MRMVFAGLYLSALTIMALHSQDGKVFFHHPNLSQNSNYVVRHASDKRVFISSTEGINIANGLVNRVYLPPDFNLEGSQLQGEVIPEENGDVWFCTYGALHRYIKELDDFEIYQFHDADSVLVDQDYWLIGGGNRSIFLKVGDDLYEVNRDDGASVNRWPLHIRDVHRLTALGNDVVTVHAAIQDTLVKYICERGNSRFDSCFIVFNQDVRSVDQLDSLHVAIGMSDGSLVLGGGKDCEVIYTSRISSDDILDVYKINDREMYLLTSGEIILYDWVSTSVKERIHPIDDKGQPIQRLLSVFVDQDSVCWIGSDGQGVYYADLKPARFDHFIPGQNIKGIHQTQNENFVFRIARQGLLVSPAEISSDALVSIGNDFTPLAGTLIHGDELLYYNYATERVEVLNTEELARHSVTYIGRDTPYFFQLEKLSSKMILGNCRHNGLVNLTLDDNAYQISSYSGISASRGKPMTYFAEDDTGRLYIGYNNETILVYDPKGPTHTFVKELNIREGVYSVSGPDSQKYTYLTTKRGLFRIHHDSLTFARVVDQDGIIQGTIYAVLRDTSGYLWMSSNKGIIRYEIASNKAWQFTEKDGVQGMEFNTHAYHQTPDGHILFGGVNGVNYFNPYEIELSTTVTPVDIYEFKVNDEINATYPKPTALSSLVVPYRDNTLSFQFLAIDYADPSSTRTKYRMTGIDDDWVPSPSAEGFARYANLAPGQYTFSILGANADGVWNPEPRNIDITVVPPFWMTWWFKGGVLLILLGTGYWLVRSYYRRRMYKQEVLLREQALIIEKQEAVEKERTRIASEMHDDLGSGLTTIKFLSERALKHADAGEADKIRRIADHSNRLVTNMSEIIWAMNSRFDTTQDLSGYIRRYTSDYLGEHGVPFTFESTGVSQAEITAEKRRNVFLVTKEVLHNIVKYSDGTSVEIRIDSGTELTVEFLETGATGFDPDQVISSGNGIFNMRKRMEVVGGNILFERVPAGMQTTIRVPL